MDWTLMLTPTGYDSHNTQAIAIYANIHELFLNLFYVHINISFNSSQHKMKQITTKQIILLITVILKIILVGQSMTKNEAIF